MTRIAKRNRLLLLPLSTVGDPVIKVKDLAGKVLDIDWSGDNYFEASKPCGIEISGGGKVGCLCVVFPSMVVSSPQV